MQRRYPKEFRHKVLDLVAAGPPVAQVAADLGISDQTIYVWRKQELIDTGPLPGASRAEQTELSAARRRIRELEQKVAILKRARELLKGEERRPGFAYPRRRSRHRDRRLAGYDRARLGHR
ncbi:transposase [Nocardia sp. NPDC006982]|uniref:transposase n=1 Tax=Nocardia sp. NPDC006982 TaxID=3364307 RepID=UPI0036A71554